MRIEVAAVGKLKERFWTDACAEYLKRLRPYAEVVVREADDCNPEACGGVTRALLREAAALERLVGEGAVRVALDRQGVMSSSEELADWLRARRDEGARVAFLVGGPHGLEQATVARCALSLSFGRMTMPHNLARVVLLEQVYRAFKIMHNEPYHR
ncbi:MAG: 23S rRNA (pseudouridine(1915)-N(3))-methyltransferase RlmH [Coriobacteriales bacterium]|jgi:23S rRNA (pseudouridine1915-N3)-methyltransferase|nr:23S rRNA (pseudouridine(1915)-N(3))-methyltransferase RlmH [Coriobacteriales bacterium]